MARIHVEYRPDLMVNGATLVGGKRLTLSWPADRGAGLGRVVAFESFNRCGMYIAGGRCLSVPWKLADYILGTGSLAYLIESVAGDPLAPSGPPALPRTDWARMDVEVQCGGCGFVSRKRTRTEQRHPPMHLCGGCGTPIIRESGRDLAVVVIAPAHAADPHLQESAGTVSDPSLFSLDADLFGEPAQLCAGAAHRLLA